MSCPVVGGPSRAGGSRTDGLMDACRCLQTCESMPTAEVTPGCAPAAASQRQTCWTGVGSKDADILKEAVCTTWVPLRVPSGRCASRRGEERCGLQRLSPLPPCRSAAGLFFFSLLAFKFLIALAAQKEEERTPTSSHPPSPSASTSSLYSARRSTFDVFFFPIWNKSPRTVTMAIPLFFFLQREKHTWREAGGGKKRARQHVSASCFCFAGSREHARELLARPSSPPSPEWSRAASGLELVSHLCSPTVAAPWCGALKVLWTCEAT